jgi:hypothetical protein
VPVSNDLATAMRPLECRRMTTLQDVLSWSMLSWLIWAVGFGVPKALREHNRFGAICSLLTGGIALIGWLLLATRTHSR